MHTPTSVCSEIIAYLQQSGVTSGEKLGPETRLFDNGLVDSMSFVMLLAFLEQRFKLSIDLTEIELDEFATPERTANSVMTLLESQRA